MILALIERIVGAIPEQADLDRLIAELGGSAHCKACGLHIEHDGHMPTCKEDDR